MESQKQIRYGIFTNHLTSSSYQGCYWMTFYAIAWYCHCVPNFLKKVMNRMSNFFVNYKTMLFQKAFLVWSGLVFNQVWIFTDLAAMYFQIRILTYTSVSCFISNNFKTWYCCIFSPCKWWRCVPWKILIISTIHIV